MLFDHYTVTLLILRSDAPALDDDGLNKLQNDHMGHLADLTRVISSRQGLCSDQPTGRSAG